MPKRLQVTIVSSRPGGNVAIGFDLGGTEFEMARACRALRLPRPEALAAAPTRRGLEVDARTVGAALSDPAGDGDPQLRSLAAYWRQLDHSLGTTVLASIA